jgi:hypothetical protein
MNEPSSECELPTPDLLPAPFDFGAADVSAEPEMLFDIARLIAAGLVSGASALT